MNIGFDAKRAFLNFTGLGNYSRAVIESLTAQYPEENYSLYTPKAIANPRTEALFRTNARIICPSSSLFKSLWRSHFITNRLVKDEIQLYHGLSNEIPFNLKARQIKSVVTIHDLIFIRYPQYYKIADRKIYTSKFRYACRNADKIVAVSEQTKRDIISYFGTNEQKIEVIYQGCDPIFSKQITDDSRAGVQARYQLPSQFILTVGTIEERKNIMLIAKAMAELPNAIHWVVIGRPTPYAQKVQTELMANGQHNRVHFLQQVDFADLPAIYKLAQAFIYPSRFEGFGIPILEALTCGTPVIAATGSCLEEAGGAHSIYIHPDDVRSLSHAISSVLTNHSLRQQMIEEGFKHAASLTNSIMADQLMQLYRGLVE
jgi:glycosyltransferase involved in cell wall biosynthesis